LVYNEAIERGDVAREQAALRRMLRSGFLSPAVLAMARWTLGTLPPRAVLLTNGDLDTYPALALQLVEGVRPDVAVLNLPMLNLPWYAKLARRRFGLPLYLPDAVLDSAYAQGLFLPSDSIVAYWRLAAARDSLGHPLVFAMTVDFAVVARPLAGRYRLAGPFFARAPAGDTLAADSAGLRAALALVPVDRLGGSQAGVGDRSPIRLSRTDGYFAGYPLYLWSVYVDLMVRAGRGAEARTNLPAIEALVRVAGPQNTYATEVLQTIRTQLGSVP
jgi:hypothetical protein